MAIEIMMKRSLSDWRLLYLIASLCAWSAQLGLQGQASGGNRAVAGATVVIEGRLIGLGSSLEGASVRLRRESNIVSPPDPNEAEYVAASGLGGKYRIEGIAPGDFRLYADMPGWTRRFYGARGEGPSDGQVLRLSAGMTLQGLDIELLPQGRISGIVRDADGNPVPNLLVSAMATSYKGSRKFLFPMQTAETDGDGAYSIRGLPPGRYLLRADHGMEHRVSGSGRVLERPVVKNMIQPAYHPSASSMDSAVPIEIRPGADVPNVGIQVGKMDVFQICGTVDHSAVALPAFLVLALVTTEFDIKATLRPNLARVQPDGSFCFDEVSPGRYFLEPARSYVSLEENSAVTGTSEIYIKSVDTSPLLFVARNPAKIDGRVTIVSTAARVSGNEVPGPMVSVALPEPRKSGAQVPPPPGSGENPLAPASGLQAASSPGISAVAPSAPPGPDPVPTTAQQPAAAAVVDNSKSSEASGLENIQIELVALGRIWINAPRGLTGKEGIFHLGRVPFVKYAVRVRNIPDGLFVQSITYNGRDLTASEFEPATDGTISVVLAYGAGTVHGIVKDEKDNLVPGAVVSLWANGELFADVRPVLRTTTGSNGRFSFANLAPGSYRILASPSEIGPALAENPSYCRAFESDAASVLIEKSQNGRQENLTISVLPLNTIRSGGW